MWARLAATALGLWLMTAPAMLGYGGAASTNDRVVGPAIASVALVAIAGATRNVRRANTVLGGWLLVSPWILGYATTATINSMIVGALVVGCSLVRGEVKDRFGGGWSALWKSDRGSQ